MIMKYYSPTTTTTMGGDRVLITCPLPASNPRCDPFRFFFHWDAYGFLIAIYDGPLLDNNVPAERASD